MSNTASAIATSSPRLWSTAQALALLATVGLLVGLVVRPELALNVLWNLLIPLVPASLLISPMLWRNVCPLATLNLLSNRSASGRTLTSALLPGAGLVGIVLLVVLVPARRFLFNTDGLALAATITVVAVLALALGALFDMKAGFCNSICPVLPVERLYGQHPLLRVANVRCTPCTMCTVKGCIDLAPARSIPATVGNRPGAAVLTTGYGAFAAAFPGFVYAYYTLSDGSLETFGAVYLRVALWSVVSYAVVAIILLALRLRTEVAMVIIAAAAASIYYWYAADTVTRAFDIAGTPTSLIRVATLALILLWTARALPAAPLRA